MQYKGIVRKRELWFEIAMLIAGGVLFYVELIRGQYFYLIVLTILMLAIFFKKEQVISEEGIDIKYYLLGIKSVSHWDWKDITSMKPDYLKARPDVILLIAKDVTIRNFRMKAADASGVMQLAKKMKPKLGSDFYTEEEQMESEKRYAAAKSRKKH